MRTIWIEELGVLVVLGVFIEVRHHHASSRPSNHPLQNGLLLFAEARDMFIVDVAVQWRYELAQ